jgi:L-serine dehydratase
MLEGMNVRQMIDRLLQKMGKELSDQTFTLGEMANIAERENLSLSRLVVAEAMVKEDKTYEEILSQIMSAFKHNLAALEIGLGRGRSFLLGTVGSELAQSDNRALIDDTLINRALIYTLATEVLARKERYNLLIDQGEVRDFADYRGAHHLPAERALSTII